MANELSAFTPEYWSKRMQIIRFKEPVFRAIANYEERSVLSNGDTVHRPYRSRQRVQTYVKNTAVSVGDVSATDEYLTVDTAKIVPFYVDDLDAAQNKWDAANKFADDAGKDLYNFIDADMLSEVVNAISYLDDGDVGGTAGTSIDLTVSNIAKMFFAAGKKLDRQNVDRKNRVAVVSPTVMQLLLEKLDGKDTSLGDSTGMNGHVGKYGGFQLFSSNSLYWAGRWTPANNPTDNDYITIGGVTITFQTSGAAVAAGDVAIGGSLSDTLDNLIACLNGTGTASATTYIALAEADRITLTGLTATNGTTYLGVTWKGGSEAVVTASEVADVWSLETVHCYFGEKGAVDLVIQEEPKVEFRLVQDKLGRNVMPWTLYGKKTFNEGAKAIVDVRINSSTLV